MTRNRAIQWNSYQANPYEIIMLNVLRFITSRCNKTNATTVSSVLEIPTSGPAKGLHGLDSHSGISVAAVINVHECRFRVITAHARSPGFYQCHIRSFCFPLFYISLPNSRSPLDVTQAIRRPRWSHLSCECHSSNSRPVTWRSVPTCVISNLDLARPIIGNPFITGAVFEMESPGYPIIHTLMR